MNTHLDRRDAAMVKRRPLSVGGIVGVGVGWSHSQ
jgi:hypothetical protein